MFEADCRSSDYREQWILKLQCSGQGEFYIHGLNTSIKSENGSAVRFTDYFSQQVIPTWHIQYTTGDMAYTIRDKNYKNPMNVKNQFLDTITTLHTSPSLILQWRTPYIFNIVSWIQNNVGKFQPYNSILGRLQDETTATQISAENN